MNLINTYRNEAIQVLNTVYSSEVSQRTAPALIQMIVAIASELITAAREDKSKLADHNFRYEVTLEIGVRVTHLVEKIFKDVFGIEMTHEYAEEKSPIQKSFQTIAMMNTLVGEPFKTHRLCLKWVEKNPFMCSQESVDALIEKMTASTSENVSDRQLTFSKNSSAPYVDVHLKCGGSDYYVHHLILVSHSDLFKRILPNRPTVSGNSIVIDCAPIFLETLLNYMYHHQFPEQNDAAFFSKLIYECEKWGVKDLAAWARNKLNLLILKEKVTEENIRYHVELSLAFNLREALIHLLKKANEFVHVNQILLVYLPKKDIAKVINVALEKGLTNLYPGLLKLAEMLLQ